MLRIGGTRRLEPVRHRLFLVLGPATEDGIEPEAEKGGDHGEDDDFVNHGLAVTCGFAGGATGRPGDSLRFYSQMVDNIK